MASASLFLVESKRNYFTRKQKKKMEHFDLKSLRYKIWLWLVRECELWRTLMANYERIPSMTPTKIISWLILHSVIVNRLFSMVERIVRKRISCVNSLKMYSKKDLREKAIIERWLRSRV